MKKEIMDIYLVCETSVEPAYVSVSNEVASAVDTYKEGKGKESVV